MIKELGLSQCNHDYTRITSHQPPAGLDYIYTNLLGRNPDFEFQLDLDLKNSIFLQNNTTNVQNMLCNF